MDIKQVYNLTNDAVKETLGDSVVLEEDLSNVISVGTAIFNAQKVDNYVKSLVNHIGKVAFVEREYKGKAPNVMIDSWEFGAILEKVRMDLPDSQENESWELEDGASYDVNVFYKPKVSAKFYNDMVTFEVPISVTEKQVKESFSNAQQLGGFISLIYTTINNKLTLDITNLTRRCVNNFIGVTIKDAYGTASLSTSSKTRAINLLYLYNQKFGATLTTDNCLDTPSFVRFATKMIKLTIGRMGEYSKLFNIGARDRFTPENKLHLVVHQELSSSADIYLQSDVYHNELTKLPDAEKVPFWQGSGEDWDETFKIKIKTTEGDSVEYDGILAVVFDNEALGINNFNKRATTNYNAKAEFTNIYNKVDARYFNDFDENFVVFFVA